VALGNLKFKGTPVEPTGGTEVSAHVVKFPDVRGNCAEEPTAPPEKLMVKE
jgi:hypothetical protein